MKEMRMIKKTYKMKTDQGTVRKDGSISSFFHSRFSHSCLGKQAMLRFSFLISSLMLLFACSSIDDDLSDCGFDVNYELKMVTNIQTKLQTQLQTDLELQTNLELTAALTTHLGTIFRDYADDVELSFYDVKGDSVLLEHDQHDMNGKEESYTLNIPRRHYLHLATANVKQEQSVEDYDVDLCHTARLAQMHLDITPFVFSRNVFGTKYAERKPFATHAVKNRLNYIIPEGCASYDCVTSTLDPANPDNQRFVEALLQRVYKTSAALSSH